MSPYCPLTVNIKFDFCLVRRRVAIDQNQVGNVTSVNSSIVSGHDSEENLIFRPVWSRHKLEVDLLVVAVPINLSEGVAALRNARHL